MRYADDFIILFENPEDMAGVKLLLKARLEQFGLAISEAKPHTTDLTPRGNGGSHERRHIKFLGFSIFRAKEPQSDRLKGPLIKGLVLKL